MIFVQEEVKTKEKPIFNQKTNKKVMVNDDRNI